MDAKPPKGRSGQTETASLAAKIVAELKAAGKRGLRVRDLLTKVGISKRVLDACLAHHREHNRKRSDRLERVCCGRYRIWARPKTRAACGALKAELMSELKAAGEAGIRVKDLAGSLGLPYRRLRHWFATTGKHCPEIERLARGLYRLRLASCKGLGELTAEILAELKAAGKSGIGLPALAANLNLPYPQVASWFYRPANLGRVEWLSPGTYRLIERTAGKRTSKRRPGGLTEQILAELKRVGDAGLRITALADRLNLPYSRVAHWFYYSGNRARVVRLGPGAYRLEERALAAKPAVKRRRGVLTAEILAELKAAGPAGLHREVLAVRLGRSVANIRSWWCTTGLRVPGVERVGRVWFRFNPA